MKAKFFLWTPRVLTILAILFMMMFSFDVFGGNEPLTRQLLGFLIHNIPAFIFTGVLVLAWKNELAGGLVFIICFLFSSIAFDSFTGNPWSLLVIGPFLLIGGLFIAYHIFFKKQQS